MKAVIRAPGYGLARLTDDLLWEADSEEFELILNSDHHYDPDRYRAGGGQAGTLELAEVIRRFAAETLFNDFAARPGKVGDAGQA